MADFKGLGIPQIEGEPTRTAPDGGYYVTISNAGVKAEMEPVETADTCRKALVSLNRKIKEYVKWRAASMKSPCVAWRQKPEAIEVGRGAFVAVARLKVCENG